MPRREAPPGDLDELTRLLMAWIGLSMRITRGAESVRSMADAGLTVAQMASLHVLMFEGPKSVGDLGAVLGHSMSATSALVQRLVEQGLVSRTEDAADRRQKVIELTAAGKKLVDRLLRARQRELRAGLEHIGSETRVDLQRVMRRIVEELSARAGELHGATPDALKESKELEADE
ncbi:MAG: MarR family transcriptional regulator [Deltaproteobacteria bacterium]|nr:MarR family transcriptional regulator [Deltaproteobacteria bacterium]